MASPTSATPKNVDAVQLGSSLATLLTVPSNTNGIKINSLTITNESATVVYKATIHLVPSGGSADDTNILCKALPIPCDGAPVELIAPQGKFLEAAGLIRGLADTADVLTVHLDYIEYN